MKVSESFGTLDDIKYGSSPKVGGLVYLSDKDPVVLMQKFDEIKAEKHIVAAYAMRAKHFLVVFVNSKIKIKKNRSKK